MVFHICRIGLRQGAQLKLSATKLGGFVGMASKMAPLALIQPSNRGLFTSTDNIVTFFMGHKFMHKFDERSKIIVVDGNIGCGKSKFSKELAEKLGMKYVPEAHLHYLDELELGPGKKYDPKFIGNVSLEQFYKDPFAKDGHSFRLQMMMYAMRFRQYSDVIEHLLKTGQGLVMERSVYSDYVFMEAMLKMGYFRRACHDYYNEIKAISLYRLRPPHLVVYLDVPVDVLQKRIQERGREMEAKIPGEYLQHIEDGYKNNFLPEISETSEVLRYDWSEYGEVDQVVDEIQMLKFKHLPWNDDDDITLDRLYRFVFNKFHVARCMDIPKYLPELTFGAQEFYDMTREFEENHDRSYSPSYNLKEGESKWKLLFK
ncbi:NADH dehydrogenase [ubiquinone] 1 alpha subcomplex subunit 10, mitochondrial-like [Patiria miniata]|uniref:NADH dehydrogenase [ubiquinone] 1 alpha subcomplex subunit 10, mitochondrial n=1 Tax=Patiria miniata TaxID=46514 RepID=A0A914BR98_PATMI|nr:NADH dehydrogenase [ubiquinone] 1 alpha subcomplex subunit 10, mitochondrial-like [Patiria miniata]